MNCVASNSVVETTIMMVEMAAIVGSMKSRNAANMCFVSVAFEPPETNIAMITSSKEVRNDNSAAVTIENLICGKVMTKNAFTLVAPRLLATRSWSRS